MLGSSVCAQRRIRRRRAGDDFFFLSHWLQQLQSLRCARPKTLSREERGSGEKNYRLVEIVKGDDDFRVGRRRGDGFSRCERCSNLSLGCSMKCSNWLSCAPRERELLLFFPPRWAACVLLCGTVGERRIHGYGSVRCKLSIYICTFVGCIHWF